MKKKNLTSLRLNKTSVSKLDRAKGGMPPPPPPPPGLTGLCFTFDPFICNIPTGDSHIVCETRQLECYILTSDC
ncbi:hypothetical protein [Kordia jejudonensis]|uniref:hypothetical protein n=1 Tax=Kordia jejudonensis TaxID=1348245 RepID=UPI0012E0ACD8|nr:hypothetical protein [Kordia jejudonensis]